MTESLRRIRLHPKHLTAFPAALVLILASSAASAETIAGQAAVIDGDTIDMYGECIRILDINALESGQTCTRPMAPNGTVTSKPPWRWRIG